MKFSEMPYERPNLILLQENINKIISAINSAKSADEQIKLVKQFEETMKNFNTLSSICEARNAIDTRDKFYEDEHNYFDEISPLLEENYNAYYKSLLESKFRCEIQKVLGDVVFKNMEMQLTAFTPEIIPLMQKENALCSDYQKLYSSAKVPFKGEMYTIAQLGKFKQSDDRETRREAWFTDGQFFDEHRQEFDEIFDKLVKNRTQQAKKLGFDNFVPLGYIRQQRNCYGPEGVANFRRQVINDLVPLVEKIKAKQAKRIGVDGLTLYDDGYNFSDGNPAPKGTPEELLAQAKKMYSEMSPQTKEFIEMMFDMDLFDIVAKDGKAPGGYCTSFQEYNCPFIFANFNGTADDVEILTHEAGHAFADYTSNKYIEFECQKSPSMEACEVHSMSMEFLTSPWHELFFKEETAKYELSHAEGTLFFIPYGTAVDNFQEIVYSHPEMTPEQRNQ
ncbi:MAG: M3 family oligoendopeptidase, partial [Oscillospiraceae bacterium]